MEKKWLVVVYCSFDGDMPVYSFETEKEASEYLRELWLDAYVDDIRENPDGLNQANSFYGRDYSVIHYNDGDYMEWYLTTLREPRPVMQTTN